MILKVFIKAKKINFTVKLNTQKKALFQSKNSEIFSLTCIIKQSFTKEAFIMGLIHCHTIFTHFTHKNNFNQTKKKGYFWCGDDENKCGNKFIFITRQFFPRFLYSTIFYK